MQLVERAVQRCERYGIGLGLEYSWEGRGQLLLAFVEQLFIELFAGTQAHDLDLDIDIGLQSSEPDHPPCNVHDLDRLTHVEHEDAAMIHAAPTRPEEGSVGKGCVRPCKSRCERYP